MTFDTINADEQAIMQFVVTHPGVQIADIMTFTEEKSARVRVE